MEKKCAILAILDLKRKRLYINSQDKLAIIMQDVNSQYNIVGCNMKSVGIDLSE